MLSISEKIRYLSSFKVSNPFFVKCIKKLSLKKNVIAKLQNNKMDKIMGGGTDTLTCMPGCRDEQSIVICELSDPCYNTNIDDNCHYVSNVHCG